MTRFATWRSSGDHVSMCPSGVEDQSISLRSFIYGVRSPFGFATVQSATAFSGFPRTNDPLLELPVIRSELPLDVPARHHDLSDSFRCVDMTSVDPPMDGISGAIISVGLWKMLFLTSGSRSCFAGLVGVLARESALEDNVSGGAVCCHSRFPLINRHLFATVDPVQSRSL